MAVVTVERVQVICDHCHLPALDLLGRPQVWSTPERACTDLAERGWSTTGSTIACRDCAACLTPIPGTPAAPAAASRWLHALPAC